jgi:hypothetical protein
MRKFFLAWKERASQISQKPSAKSQPTAPIAQTASAELIAASMKSKRLKGLGRSPSSSANSTPHRSSRIRRKSSQRSGPAPAPPAKVLRLSKNASGPFSRAQPSSRQGHWTSRADAHILFKSRRAVKPLQDRPTWDFGGASRGFRGAFPPYQGSFPRENRRERTGNGSFPIARGM